MTMMIQRVLRSVFSKSDSSINSWTDGVATVNELRVCAENMEVQASVIN